MKSKPNKDFCVKLDNVSKFYMKNLNLKVNEDQRLKKLISILFGNDNGEKKDKRKFYALENVSLNIKKGDSLGIVGLNGSGKSTLMQIIAGTLKPSSGKIIVHGKVAALLELGSGFNPDFTGRENVIINGKILGLNDPEIKTKLKNIQNFAEIGDFFDQPVSTYSSGMVLRLAFSVLAQVRPDILIIDEALAVGDARFQLKCFSFLEEFKNKGGTLILVSHDLNSIARLCSHSILLHEGCLLAAGKPNDVINEYSKFISLNNVISPILDNEKIDFNGGKKVDYDLRSSNEFSYGGIKARIKNFKLINSTGDETQVLQSGEQFTVLFEVYSSEIIQNPIYAVTIKDSKGLQVYGQNTHFANVKVKDLGVDDTKVIEFKQCCNLGVGEYFISLGVTRFDGENLEIIHRKYDLIEFKVINLDGSFGIANCFSQIRIK